MHVGGNYNHIAWLYLHVVNEQKISDEHMLGRQSVTRQVEEDWPTLLFG